MYSRHSSLRYVLLWHGPASSFAAGAETRRGYYLTAGYFSFMLLVYPIAWACSEGGNVISVTAEMVWYGILDILTGPVFLAMFLWELRNTSYESFGLNSSRNVNSVGGMRGEKGALPTTAGTTAYGGNSMGNTTGTFGNPAGNSTGAYGSPAPAQGSAVPMTTQIPERAV